MENGRQATGTIILTGYFQSAVEEIYEMLTSDIKISMKSIIKAQVSQAKEFDQYVAQTVTKCIIAATYTERMNLLIEGRDTGQVTDLYYKAGKKDILLICVGLPKRQFKQIKTTSHIYHQELSALFSTQTLLGDLAKKKRFLSVLRGGKLDKEQISALNTFVTPSQQIKHDKQIKAGQGQTSHQSVDDKGAGIVVGRDDHQDDQQDPMNSTEEQEGSPNVGYNHDKNITYKHHSEERLDRKEDRRIMLTGFDCEFINKAYDLLTKDLKVRLSGSLTFIEAALHTTYDFDDKVPKDCTKCIIVAPSTTSMNFLSEKSGQFTSLYHKATKRQMDTMLLCMDMPSGGFLKKICTVLLYVADACESVFFEKKTLSIDNRRLYHKDLNDLFPWQPKLKELAERKKLISLSTDEPLDEVQIRAVKNFGFNCSD